LISGQGLFAGDREWQQLHAFENVREKTKQKRAQNQTNKKE